MSSPNSSASPRPRLVSIPAPGYIATFELDVRMPNSVLSTVPAIASWAQAEIYKTTFQSDEWTKSTVRWLQRRPEQSMSEANRCVLNRGNITVRNIAVNLVEVDPVVVSKFPFHYHFAMYAVAQPSTHSEVVGVCLGNADIVANIPASTRSCANNGRGELPHSRRTIAMTASFHQRACTSLNLPTLLHCSHVPARLGGLPWLT